MRRILIFALAYRPFVGGAELAMEKVTARLSQKEFSFDLITLRFDSSLPAVEKVGNVTVHRIGFATPGAKVSDRSMPWRGKVAKCLFPIIAYRKARALHQERAFDTVWALMANQAAFAALFFKRKYPDIPYLLELQDGRALSHMKKRQPILHFLWPLYRGIYCKADRIKAISQFIAREVRAIGYTGEVLVIPNGVDVSRFSAPVSEEKLKELRARYGKRMSAQGGSALGRGDIFLFTASRLVLSRGVEDIIRALPHLPPEVKLLIAGDGEDREKLEGIAHDSGVEGRVIFAGHVPHEELPPYFKMCDIFVRPSIIEGMGSAFIEAFAAGIPVVATPVGGIPDFLRDGETGLFCNVHDPESVAQAVRRYLDDPALVARVVKNAKELAAERYDWDLIARDMREKFLRAGV